MMIRKQLFLLIVLLISGCKDPQDTSSNQGGSSIQLSSPSESSLLSFQTTTASNHGWNNQISTEMNQILGMTIPYIDAFEGKYDYFTGFMDGSNIPYINPYIKGGSNWINQYTSAVLNDNYQLDIIEKDEDDVTWHYYFKTIGQSTINIQFSYYFSEGFNWFDIYAYVEGERQGDLPIPDSYDIIIEPTQFQSKSYPSSITNLTISGANFSYKDIMNQSGMVQFKNTSGVLYNTSPLSRLYCLYLEDVDYIDRIAVYGGTSQTSLTLITSYNRVYDLEGYTYFKVSSNSNGVVKMSSIQIVYK